MDLGLAGKKVVVIGAGPNLGFAVCRTLAQEGACVSVLSRTSAALDAARDHIRQVRGDDRGCFLACDAADEESLKTAFATVAQGTGGFDAVICNVGPVFVGEWDSLTADDWGQRCRDNMQPFYFSLKHGARLLERHGGGSMLVVGSVSAYQPGGISTPDHGVFKLGLINLVKRASQELAPRGISVNMVSPGLIDDAAGPSTFRQQLAQRLEQTDAAGAVRDYSSSRIPFGRPANAAEVAGLITFLASPRASYVTGQNLIVDGGYTKGISI